MYFIVLGFIIEGWAGAALYFVFFASLISISKLAPRFSRLYRNLRDINDSLNSIEKSLQYRRVTYVRIQKPKVLVMRIDIGGKMLAGAWKDVCVQRYETYPRKALEKAVEDYDGYHISHYAEYEDDIEDPMGEISKETWIKVNPERDLPDE